MKNILLTIIATGTLLSAEPCYFIGLDLQKVQIDHTQDDNYDLSGWNWNNNSQNAVNLNIGAYLDENSRLYADFTNFSLSDANHNSIGAGFDYLYGDRDFQPFIGVVAGYSMLDYKDSAVSTDAGFHYGIQAGISYDIGILSLETGLRHIISTISHAGNHKATDVAYNMELKSFTGWFIGIKHLF